jgi:phosphopantothenoylcysteine decarboxylase/phosphopantothenate--cysteine ligase
MLDAVLAQLPSATVFIGVAAVADYRPSGAATQKLKKTAARLALELEPTTDILATVGSQRGDRIVIGFAAETENVLAEARRKLEVKNCDLIVANQVGQSGTGFEADENEVTLVTRHADPRPLPRAAKLTLSHQILDTLSELRLARHSR